jgi:chaperonin GroES
MAKKLALTPLSNRVIVKQDEAQKKIKTIHIADTAQVKPNTGEVVAVGKGFSEEFPMEIKVGDRILFEKGSGTEVIIDDVEYLILRDPSVICTLQDNKMIVRLS